MLLYTAFLYVASKLRVQVNDILIVLCSKVILDSFYKKNFSKKTPIKKGMYEIKKSVLPKD